MAENSSTDSIGRKVFFLYPSLLMRTQIAEGLALEEFEVYSVKDEIKLSRVLKKYSDSIVFANISDGMSESAWEDWIRSIMMDSETANIDIGIIAYGENATMRHKYIELLRVRCGFTVIKPDISATVKQLASILNDINAKGRRKYVRVMTDKEPDVTVSLPTNGTFVNGVIKDISTAAFSFSCSFEQDPELVKNSHFTGIHIRLQTQYLKVNGMVLGSRMQGTEKIYVILLSQHTPPDVQTVIRKFTRTLLQSRMDDEFKD